MDQPQVLLATNRPLVHHLFLHLAPPYSLSVSLSRVSLDAEALVAHHDDLAAATVAAVDAAPDPVVAIQMCQELHRCRPALPIVALICCSCQLIPSQFHSLLAAGVGSVLDSTGTPEQLLRATQYAARGERTLQLRLDSGHDYLLTDVVLGSHDPMSKRAPLDRLSPVDAKLLALLADGLYDKEIAERLCLSRHTVKHHIECLRETVGARNRTELAAWAGQQGFRRTRLSRERIPSRPEVI